MPHAIGSSPHVSCLKQLSQYAESLSAIPNSLCIRRAHNASTTAWWMQYDHGLSATLYQAALVHRTWSFTDMSWVAAL
eukprot:2961922-Amphidinium_carterae.1